MRVLLVAIAFVLGLSALSDAGLLCWKDALALRCDVLSSDWDTETERRYVEEQEAAAAAIAHSEVPSDPALDPITVDPSTPSDLESSGRHYDCQVAETTSAGIPTPTCTP